MDPRPRVLVATGTHTIKEYGLPRWVAAVNALTYQPVETLLVDNSPDLGLYNRWKAETGIIHLSIDGTPHQRIAISMETIRRYMLRANFDFWLSIECDIIAPPDTIETMLDWAASVPANWYCMPAPARHNPFLFSQNFMCALFPRRLCEQISFNGAPATRATDGWFMQQLDTLHLEWTSTPPRQLALEHLANPDREKDIVW